MEKVDVWLRWDKVPGVNRYDVYRKKYYDPGFEDASYFKIGTTDRPYFQDVIEPGIKYTWKVVAVNEQGAWSDYSKEADFCIEIKPEAPVNLTVNTEG
jgi:hypothetical protein